FSFFFQAEDGIRDFHVTGVQTCALPIYEVLQVVGLAGIGMVVGEVAVDLAIQRNHFGTDRFEHLRPDLPGDAVASVHHDLDRPIELHVGSDPRHVRFADVALHQRSGGFGDVQAALADAVVEVGDRLAGQRGTADHDLEAVVVRRVVAAGDRDTATGA